MPTANIDDRASIEAIYPRAAFDADSANNARSTNAVAHGVLILSEVSEAGDFTLDPSSRQVGEGDPESDTLFLVPYPDEGAVASPAAGAGYGGQQEAASPRPDTSADEYSRFIDQVIETAKGARFKATIGQDSRLHGFRGG